MREELDGHLADARQRLLERIEEPSFAVVSRRASSIRRRRAGTAAAVVAVLFVGTLTARSMATEGDLAPTPGASGSPTPTPLVYAEAGITINGVPGVVANLPGQVFDVEYLDADRGYLLANECGPADNPCSTTFARTGDGGRTWLTRAWPEANRAVSRRTPPLLFTLGERLVVTDEPARVRAGDRLRRYVSDDGGTGWRVEDGPVLAAPPQAGLAWPRNGRPVLLPDGEGYTVFGWHPTATGVELAVPPSQPPLAVEWVAAVPDAIGGWWVAGTVDGAPAISVTRDGGATWSAARRFAGEGAAHARLATLGAHVYVVTYGGRVTVYHSGDLGSTFNAGTATGYLRTVRGDPVALLDGRLVLVGDDGHWFVATDPSGTPSWRRAPSLHPTGRLERTAYGYVAHDLSGDFTAFSVDGSTWRKLAVM